MKLIGQPQLGLSPRPSVVGIQRLASGTGPSRAKKGRIVGRVLSQKNYEKEKRERTFLPSWQEEFLCLKNTTEGMLCSVCHAHPTYADVRSSLYLGTASYRKGVLVSHEASTSHNKCLDIDGRRRRQLDAVLPQVQGPVDRQLQNMNEQEEEAMMHLFNTAYFILKEESPFSCYPKLIGLQEKNGAKMGTQYKTDNACRRFSEYIYNDVMRPTFGLLSTCKMMGIMFGGATDKSVRWNWCTPAQL